MSSQDKTKDFSPKPFIIGGYLTIFITFGVLGGWAATAPLDSAVIAPGVLSVESSKKIVDHLEGGIVKEILVDDSDTVKAGDVLVRLSEIKSQANASMVDTRYMIARAELARLETERANEAELVFPEDLMASDDVRIKYAMKTQQDLFRDRVSVRNSQISILDSKVAQLKNQISGLELQRDAAKQEIDLIAEEVERLQDGTNKGVVSTNRLSSLRREQAQLTGAFGRLVSDIARVNESIGETELEIVRIRQSFSERAATELGEVRQELAELEEQQVVAADVLDRTEIRAQVDGIVQNMQVHTIGGVIKPGAPIMEIVPTDDEIVINANIRTLDIDNIYPGLEAEVRLSAFTSRYLPSIFGKIAYVSPDTIQPTNQNEQPYYLARIVVPDSEIPEEVLGKLTPGMPAEIIIPTGERTVVEYLVQPLEDAVRNSMREE
ncbi:HlyD family type I secretion periplasmic adaptor subunit [Roseibium hamelinense]|nr:HlyD family type I secretion periplasmic adaptor subunit [Roseibium hamelinense]